MPCRVGSDRGSALIDVLLALSIVATLAVTSSQIQLKQRRLQDLLAQRLTASALLDAWAERRQMTVFAASNDTHAARERVLAAASANAALQLPNGRAYEHQMGAAIVELEIRWRAPRPLTKRGINLNGVDMTSRRSGQAHHGAQGRDEHLSESILVGSTP